MKVARDVFPFPFFFFFPFCFFPSFLNVSFPFRWAESFPHQQTTQVTAISQSWSCTSVPSCHEMCYHHGIKHVNQKPKSHKRRGRQEIRTKRRVRYLAFVVRTNGRDVLLIEAIVDIATNQTCFPTRRVAHNQHFDDVTACRVMNKVNCLRHCSFGLSRCFFYTKKARYFCGK